MTRAAVLAGITTITFDAGGTLLEPHPSVGAVYHEYGRRHGCVHDAATLESAFRHAFHTVSKSSLQLDPTARERDFWRRVVTATFAGDPGLPPAARPALFAELWEAFAHGDRWRVLPGAVTTLRTLRDRGYRLGVLSNWDPRLHRVLAETGLAPWFDHVLISSEVGAEKPDPGIFRAAETRFQTTAPHCLHVGDSIPHDEAGARAAGWAAVLLCRGDAVPASPHVVTTLPDLLELLPPRGPGADRDASATDVLHSSAGPDGP